MAVDIPSDFTSRLAGPTWPEITEILTNGDRTYGIQTLYRALFAVKQQGVNTETNIALLERSLRRTAHRESVLFRHECCYLLGQFGADSSCFTSKKLAFEALFEILTDEGEDEVTRHEAAEGIAAVFNNNVEHLESEVIAFFEKLGRTSDAPGEGDLEQVGAALLQSGSDTEDDMQQDENVVSDRTGSRTEPNKLKVHNDHDEKFSATTKALFRRRNARLIELLQRYFDEKTDEAGGPAEQVRRFPALAETCFLAVEGLKRETARVCACQYASYDPALGYPNATEQDIPALWQQLKKRASATSSTTPTSLRSSSTEDDADRGLFSRYRAMFTLRNLNAVAPLADVLRTDQTSPVLRHEIAFILGQMEDEEAVAALVANLEDVHEHPMARHESAIALGSIGGEAAKAGLLRFVEDGEQMVAESCLVALDTIEYWEMWEREEKRIRG